MRAYHEIMKELEELRDDTLNESPLPSDGLPRGNETSDPTFDRAMRLITCKRLNQMHKTVWAIGNIVWKLPPDKLKLVQLTYWEKPQRLTSYGIAMKLNCGRKTYYRWRDEICEAIAIELGWIK